MSKFHSRITFRNSDVLSCLIARTCKRQGQKREVISCQALMFRISNINICSFSFCSGPEGQDATHAAAPRPVRLDKRGPAALPFLPFGIYLSAAASRALPHVALWQSVYAAQQHHGHREHLRTGGPHAVQCCGMGQEYSLLPRPSDHRPGGSAEAHLERVVRPKRSTVLHATACSPSASRRRPPRLPHVRGQSGRLYGPH